jgi:hypothetical protein
MFPLNRYLLNTLPMITLVSFFSFFLIIGKNYSLIIYLHDMLVVHIFCWNKKLLLFILFLAIKMYTQQRLYWCQTKYMYRVNTQKKELKRTGDDFSLDDWLIDFFKKVNIKWIIFSHGPHDEHRSSGLKPVKLCLDQTIFHFLFRTTCISKLIQEFDSDQ